MTDFRKLLAIPLLAGWIFANVGCGKKKIALQPPPAPPPAVTASNSTPPSSGLTRREEPAPKPATENQNARYPDQATRERIDKLLARISDAYFDYDQHNLRPDAVKTLQADSIELRDILKQYPDYKLVIEGHADERGSDEYNLGLGDARAESAKSFLVQIGIPSGQLSTVSFGKERPACTDHNETCWQKNRRIHIVPAPNQPA